MEINPVNLVRQGSSTTLEAGQTTTGCSYQHVDFSTKIIKGSLNLDPIAAFRLIFVRFEQPRRECYRHISGGFSWVGNKADTKNHGKVKPVNTNTEKNVRIKWDKFKENVRAFFP